ncbi:MAG: DUF167 domain-containing protein [Candidatus Nanoarchaeia archaeon]|nr:DUF167 domain-containing protein [Candidatus Nanoarchaeia archaeon]
MKIKVKVIANAKEDKIDKIDESTYRIRIKAKPVEGKANIYLIKILEEYFDSKAELVSGRTSKIKVFEIFK